MHLVLPLLLTTFRTPDAINADIEDIAVQYGYRLDTLGYSVNGVPLLGLRSGLPEMPGVRILGGHHGDEPASVEFPLALARQLAAPQDRHVLIVPLVNPDGYGERSRYNARGVDLNRNYGFEYRTGQFAAGAHAYSEPETRAIALDSEYHRYGVSLSYHTGAFNIGYPFNYTTAPMDAEGQLRGIAQRYRDLVGGDFELVRGGAWFISFGDLNDYSFGYYGTADLTVELVTAKAADPPLWPQHLGAAADVVRREQRVVQVTDSEGLPLPAFVSTSSVTVTADPVRGLATLHEGGEYTVSYPGYGADLSPTEASVRARSLVTPFSSAATDELRHAHGDFTGLRALRPGSDSIVFTCEDECVAAAAPRRPGHYDLLVTFADGSEGVVRNALLLRERSGDRVTVEGGDYVFAGEAWLVERGKGARLFTGRIAAPETTATVDIGWVEGGAFVVQTMFGDDGTPLQPRGGHSRGCNAAPDVCLIAFAALAYVRRWMRIRTTT